ncbi:MAG: hypothetical protein E7399_04900 [Ruminococcaceae bacterium]|nr:hypothetical protein [Oscillospiraceae bacterium]
MSELIRLGNVERTNQSGTPLSLYMGSGDFGGCFDCYGQTETGLMHGDFYHNGVFGMDFYAKSVQLRYQNFFPDKVTATQKMDLYDGQLMTKLEGKDFLLNTTLFFHPYRRDLLGIEVEFSGNCPVLSVCPMEEYEFSYQQFLHSELELLKEQKQECTVQVTAGTACKKATLQLFGDGTCTFSKGRIDVSFLGEQGSALIVFGFADELDVCPNTFKEEAMEGWHQRWGKARISFEDKKLLGLFYRGTYSVLCSHSPTNRFIAPPMGWAGKAWMLHFPQDFEYLCPLLIKLGHLDIVKGKTEYYHSYIDAMQSYTKRIYGADGVMWAWEFPVGDGWNLFPENKAPNIYQFEIHNSAYPAKLAYETARVLQDEEWSKKYAWGIVYQSALFYNSVLKKEGTTWGIALTPSMSQDEGAGMNQKNYLCALYAARFCLQTAVKMAEELEIPCKELNEWKEKLADGLAFDKLEHPDGMYMTHQCDPKEFAFGKMQYPVPLCPASFLPVGELNEYEKTAYHRRLSLCRESEEGVFFGWTLPDCILASAHMGDREGFWEGMNRFLQADYMDKDWIQTYESTGAYHKSHYVTNLAILCDSIINGIVTDYFGQVIVNGAGFLELQYENLYLSDGQAISG